MDTSTVTLLLPVLAPLTFFAAVVQGAVGVGATLIALPFFLPIVRSTEAVQLLIAINLIISLTLIGPLRGRVPPGATLRLGAGLVAGLPAGLWVFAHIDVATIRLLLALALAVATTMLGYEASGRLAARPRRDPGIRGSTAAGFIAGALTATLAAPGPAVAVYLAWLGVPRDTFRALILTLYVAAYGAALLLQATVVGMSGASWTLAAALAPVAAGGALVGHALARRLDARRFRAAVLTLLAGTTAYLVWSSVSSVG